MSHRLASEEPQIRLTQEFCKVAAGCFNEIPSMQKAIKKLPTHAKPIGLEQNIISLINAIDLEDDDDGAIETAKHTLKQTLKTESFKYRGELETHNDGTIDAAINDLVRRIKYARRESVPLTTRAPQQS